MTVLTDPRYVVPPLPDPDGGALDRLRRAVPRFATGAAHTARRAEADRLLATLDPASLRTAARDLAATRLATGDRPGSRRPVVSAPAAGEPAPVPGVPSAAPLGAGDSAAVGVLVPGVPGVPLGAGDSAAVGVLVPGVPVAVLAGALGAGDPVAVAALVPVVAAAYFPAAAGTSGERAAADAAVDELVRSGLDLARIGLLVQACAPVAALVRAALARGLADPAAALAGDGGPPVPATRRWRPDTGETVTVPLDGIPFGAGPRRCPAEPHALALAAGVLAALAGAR